MIPGSVPPDFGFGNEGVFYKISQLRGLRRILLIFCPDGMESACRDRMREVREKNEEYRKRNIITMVISPAKEDTLIQIGHDEPSPIILISDEKCDTMAAYGVKGMNSLTVFLIGKDGTTYASWTHWPSSERVFRTVDSMPPREHCEVA